MSPRWRRKDLPHSLEVQLEAFSCYKSLCQDFAACRAASFGSTAPSKPGSCSLPWKGQRGSAEPQRLTAVGLGLCRAPSFPELRERAGDLAGEVEWI